jgi:hypothetical protein
MLIRNWFPPDDASALLTEFGLFNPGMDRFESMKTFLERWRQPIIRFDLIHKCGVTTNLWTVQDI